MEYTKIDPNSLTHSFHGDFYLYKWGVQGSLELIVVDLEARLQALEMFDFTEKWIRGKVQIRKISKRTMTMQI